MDELAKAIRALTEEMREEVESFVEKSENERQAITEKLTEDIRKVNSTALAMLVSFLVHAN